MQTSYHKNNKLDPTSVNKLLSQKSLQFMKQKVRTLQAAHELFISSLPESLAECTGVLAMNYDTITLYAENGTIATQLRFMSNNILSHFRYYDIFQRIKKIKIVVSHNTKVKLREAETKVNKLSPAAKQTLQGSLDAIEHPALKEALQRFMNHANGK
jgi:Cdc6-like AAA superfamily ATPase